MQQKKGIKGAHGHKELRHDSDCIPFVTSDKSGKFSVSAEAIRVLSAFHVPYRVLVVAGTYRSGKSYLLNRLLGTAVTRENKFPVGHTIHACTQGIMMYRHLVRVDNLGKEEAEGGGDEANAQWALVLDTEGLGSMESHANEAYDLQIFCLAVLLSSKFIYNSMGKIDEPSLTKLAMVVSLAQRLRVNDKPIASLPLAEKQNYFPDLLWVVRDFGLELTDDSDPPLRISASEWMENALAPVSSAASTGGGENKNLDRNAMRKAITDVFVQRDCVTLPSPCPEKYRSQLEDGTAKVDPDFVRQMHNLRMFALQSSRTKTLGNGKPITGAAYAQFAESLVRSMNGNELPVLTNQFAMLGRIQCQAAFDAARDRFSKECQRMHLGEEAKNPKSVSDELTLLENRVLQKVFDESADGEPTMVRDFRNRLEQELRQVRDRILTDNRVQVEQYALYMNDEFLVKHLDSSSSYDDFLKNRYAKAVEGFTTHCGSDQLVLDIWARIFLNKSFEWTHRFYGAQTAEFNKTKAALVDAQAKLAEANPLLEQVGVLQLKVDTLAQQLADTLVKCTTQDEEKNTLHAANMKLRTDVAQIEVLAQERNLLQDEVKQLRARLATVEQETKKAAQGHQQNMMTLQQSIAKQLGDLRQQHTQATADLARITAQGERQVDELRRSLEGERDKGQNQRRELDMAQHRATEGKKALEDAQAQWSLDKTHHQQAVERLNLQLREDEQRSRENERRMSQELLKCTTSLTKLETELTNYKQKYNELEQKHKTEDRTMRAAENALRAELDEKRIDSARNGAMILMLQTRVKDHAEQEQELHTRIRALDAQLQKAEMDASNSVFRNALNVGGGGGNTP